jgi:putative thioredoxin
MTTAAAPSKSQWIRDVGAADFAQAVLARSSAKPVVVDFWAAWCGPCRVLGPVLEREIESLSGRVELAKVDTDANPELAMDYGIQGIPAVKAFRDGRVVAEFVGARPATFVRSWLESLVPPPELSALDEAERAAKAGDRATAEPALWKLIEEADRNREVDRLVGARALAALARLRLDARDVAAAEPLVARLDTRGDAPELAENLKRRLRFFADAATVGGADAARAALERDPEDREARYGLASALAADGDYAGALEQFLELAASARKARGEDARRAMLAVFAELGADDPLTQDFRRRLQVVT